MTIQSIVRAQQLFFSVLRQDPRSVRFVPQWFRSLRLKYPAVRDLPSVTFKALAWLRGFLKPDMRVFEYGTGGSTLFFAARVRKVISVEHDKNWYERFTQILAEHPTSACEVLLCEPEAMTPQDARTAEIQPYTSRNKQYKDVHFAAYVKSIDRYPDQHFDLVLIDGRSRPSCVRHAIPKIRSGGYLMLDNSDRPEYAEVDPLLSAYTRTDFYGIGPYWDVYWQTSIWRIIH